MQIYTPKTDLTTALYQAALEVKADLVSRGRTR